MLRLFLILSIAFLLTLPARAQTVSSTGAIQGTILDPTGAAVAGARLTARNVNSGTVRATEADSSGHFSIVGLLSARTYCGWRTKASPLSGLRRSWSR